MLKPNSTRSVGSKCTLRPACPTQEAQQSQALLRVSAEAVVVRRGSDHCCLPRGQQFGRQVVVHTAAEHKLTLLSKIHAPIPLTASPRSVRSPATALEWTPSCVESPNSAINYPLGAGRKSPVGRVDPQLR